MEIPDKHPHYSSMLTEAKRKFRKEKWLDEAAFDQKQICFGRKNLVMVPGAGVELALYSISYKDLA
jgi:hypothetical protein